MNLSIRASRRRKRIAYATSALFILAGTIDGFFIDFTTETGQGILLFASLVVAIVADGMNHALNQQ